MFWGSKWVKNKNVEAQKKIRRSYKKKSVYSAATRLRLWLKAYGCCCAFRDPHAALREGRSVGPPVRQFFRRLVDFKYFKYVVHSYHPQPLSTGLQIQLLFLPGALFWNGHAAVLAQKLLSRTVDMERKVVWSNEKRKGLLKILSEETTWEKKTFLTCFYIILIKYFI